MRLIALPIAVLSLFQLTAQDLNDVGRLGERDWVYFHDGVDITADEFVNLYATELGLTDQDELVLKISQTDDVGFEHRRYQQFHSGVRVEAAEYITHAQYGLLNTANGKLIKGLNISTGAGIDEATAIQLAINHIGADRYMWESEAGESLLQRIEKDPNATYYPDPELVIYDPKYSDDPNAYQLCYKIDIYAVSPNSRDWVYVDAQTGAIAGTMTQVHEDVPGVAETRYSGTQTMLVDSITPGYYILQEHTRGDGVETYNMQTVSSDFIPDSAVDFFDADNYWDNANPQFDDAATDVHWGNEQVYDYFLGEHALDSYDGNGKLIVAYVHVGVAWFNARFVGDWMEYGDGSGNPLTSIDVVAHEVTHGVTRNSSNLIYSFESGALNESFSDIFGTAVERYATPDSLDWFVGKVNFTLRDMSNPNAYNDPDTYQGNHWEFGFADNGGVHTNSGVQNHWFYLLSEGGSGVNDNSDAFNVAGIGFDNAEDIAFRNLVYYLTPSSNYADARQGSIQATVDLFGSCSFEVQQVVDAWHAVGVGADTVTHDVKLIEVTSPVTGCKLTTTEQVDIEFVFFESGCGDYILPTDSIQLGYAVDGGSPVLEYYHPTDTMWGMDTVQYTFATTADLSTPADYDVDVWVNYSQDGQPTNDSVMDISILNPVQVQDGLIDFENYLTIYDSMMVRKGDDGRVDIHTFASVGPGFGLRLSGNNPNGDRHFEMPGSAAEIWTMNPDYFASACFCVDATGMSAVNLGFELAMQYSRFYYDEFGFDLPLLGSSMRVMVDGQRVSPDYHPSTYQDDPFMTHVINLDSLAGTEFELCFEAMCFMRIESDIWPESRGDNAFIDNVWIGEVVSVPEEESNLGVSVFPNPSTGGFTLTTNQLMDAQVEVYDVIGSMIFVNSWIGNVLELDLTGSPGMYYIKVIQKDQQQVLPLIIR